MISVERALELIIEAAGRQATVRLPFLEALGLALAEPVVADLDSPPFDKALMDGYAIRSVDLGAGPQGFELVGSVVAGSRPDGEVGPRQAMLIMTGAAIPQGADAVVMREESAVDASGCVSFERTRVEAGENVMPAGKEMKAGDTVLRPGRRLSPSDIGVLASAGCTLPLVYQRPRIAVISTGDELVAPGMRPGPGQIRDSNTSTILALARSAHAEVEDLGSVGDELEATRDRIERGLGSDLLILSGGVSAGDRDLVPEALARAGVEPIFHKVAMKPGKPLWFGRRASTLVFGLPGNPVSVLAAFEVFVRTALRARMGVLAPRPVLVPTVLAKELRPAGGRHLFHPARVEMADDGITSFPVPWFGSADLRALTEANALLSVPPGTDLLLPGAPVRALMIRSEV